MYTCMDVCMWINSSVHVSMYVYVKKKSDYSFKILITNETCISIVSFAQLNLSLTLFCVGLTFRGDRLL